jgi:hypothetical protein
MSDKKRQLQISTCRPASIYPYTQLTVPFPLRFPLAFAGKLLGQVLRIFIDIVAANYRKRLAERGIASGVLG